MYELEVEIDKSSAMRSNEAFDRIQILYFLRPGVRLTVGRQCEMGIPRDATAAHAIWKQRLLLPIYWAKREETCLKLVRRTDIADVPVLLQAQIRLEKRRHR